MLTSVETSDRSRQEVLENIQLALNCSVHRITGASPLELLIGRIRPLNLRTFNHSEPEIDINKTREQAASNIKKSTSNEKSRFVNY